MNKSHGYVTELGRRAEAAAAATTDAVQSGLIDSSSAITTALRDELDRRLAGTVAGSTVLTRAADTDPVGDDGPPTGADLVLSFHTHFSDYRSGTGVLLATTQLRDGRSPSLDRLTERCHRMLRQSPASYVLVVESETMTVLPAVAVVGAADIPTACRDAYYYKSFAPFLIEFFAAFVGDRALCGDADRVAETLAEYDISAGLAVSIGPEQAGLSDFL